MKYQDHRGQYIRGFHSLEKFASGEIFVIAQDSIFLFSEIFQLQMKLEKFASLAMTLFVTKIYIIAATQVELIWIKDLSGITINEKDFHKEFWRDVETECKKMLDKLSTKVPADADNNEAEKPQEGTSIPPDQAKARRNIWIGK